VLPGSLLIGVAVLVWSVDSASGLGWTVFAAVAVLLVCGSVASVVLTGQQVTAAGVPRSSLVVAGLAGLVGMVVVPVVGLALFFALGLVLMEYRRRRQLQPALSAAWLALRATGLGMLLELSAASTAAGIWLIAVLVGV